jgi:hypothetical protein
VLNYFQKVSTHPANQESNKSTVMAGAILPQLVLRVIGCCHITICFMTDCVEVDANTWGRAESGAARPSFLNL